MVLAQPEQRVGEQEVAHLVAAVVEDERAPVRVRAAARILVLVERGAVEPREREVVAREVRRHPVEDHAEPVLVQPVDELAQVVGRAVARRGREVAGHLVAPGAAERVRHHRHQLDVREAHVARVRRQLVGQLEVRERAVALERVQPPGAEVDLVDRDRRVDLRGLAPRCQPLGVGPLVRRLEDHRRRLRRQLGRERERIRLEPDLAGLGEDLELVVRARLRRRGGTAPRCRSSRATRIGFRRPSHELKSPTTETERALGAQTANAVPRTPWCSITCAPSFA